MKLDYAINKTIIKKANTVGTRMKKLLLGMQGNDGLVFKTFIYALLISVGFIYLYPILYMVSESFKSLRDLLDPTVLWIPKELYFDNFVKAWNVLEFPKTFMTSLLNSVLPAVTQMVSCAIVGFGFARFKFPGKNILFGLMLLTFIIPTQIVMIPMFLMFEQYGMLGTPLPFILPAIFAGGIKSALFILIYTQFFKSIPQVLDESAQLDGANYLTIFFRIILPISIPALVVVFLFSLVWHWNETYTASLYLGDSMSTLPLKLKEFNDSFKALYSSAGAEGKGADINESIKFAGTVLVILPLLVLYMFAQKWFVEVLDKTGITGE
ncbi:carbohydrate ABC transporter permease [Alkalihalobacillus sp. TS-13]|uniref:carbohydrate ABC transporter permease n=1 Tax=Alkalihalobacillus sp. TS-13 TaxID=2842455 RepID=UPI0021AAB6C6|nr:carbohydrate ABC transporter permease [Alkalihalobacillus sp. TS-13]